MLNRNYAQTIASIANSGANLITAPKNEDYIAIMRQAGEDYQKGKQLQADNAFTEEMVKLHPEEEARIRQMGGRAYADVMQGREWQKEDADTQFARQKELADLQYNRSLALENVRNQNAIGLKKLALDLKNQTDEQAKADSLDLAQQGINQLAQVGKDNNIGVFTNWRREHGLTGKDVENDLGKISSGVAAIAPKAISNLKAAGVSGINSLPEFMTYIGLPQNPTSKQILGALPMMAQIAGVKNPLAEAQSAPKASDPLGLR